MIPIPPQVRLGSNSCSTLFQGRVRMSGEATCKNRRIEKGGSVGKRNRQRRVEKQRSRGRTTSNTYGRASADDPNRSRESTGRHGGGGDAKMVTLTWALAGQAWCEGDSTAAEKMIRLLAEQLTAQRFVGEIETAMAGLFAQMLARAKGLGWQPSDLERIVRRRHDARHARFALDTIARWAAAVPGSLDESETAQLADLQGLADLEGGVWWSASEAHVVAFARREGISAFEALFVGLVTSHEMGHIYRLADVGGEAQRAGSATGPGRTGSLGIEPKVLARVRALLAKAESTTFPEEAEALAAKAQELMTRHAIDRALLDASGSDRIRSTPIARRVPIDDPYAHAKSLLIDRVAAANRCRAVWDTELGVTTLVGFGVDVEIVEVLHASLLVQATTAMLAAGRNASAGGRARSRSYRQSFLVAYAIRIGQRLQEAATATQADATTEFGSRLLPVLAGRTEAVQDATTTAFPTLASKAIATNDWAGWSAGLSAADLARLNPYQALPA